MRGALRWRIIRLANWEYLSMTTAATGHIELARMFLERSKQYLKDGDLHQASEKGWGAAAHMAKAAAAANGRRYEHHDEFDSVIENARQRFRQPSLRRYGQAAHSLHRNYYRHPSLLDASTITEDIGDVELMLDTLQPFIR